MARGKPTNKDIAELLERIADLLEATDTNPFKVRAYRNGANSVRDQETPVADYIVKDNFERLREVPGIGAGLGAVIGQYVVEGRSDLLNDLEAEVTPVQVFQRVPGLGQDLAQRIVDTLHISTLEDLEEAAHDGRLATVEGFGERRVEAVQASLGGILQRGPRKRERSSGNSPMSVEMLLDVDAEYRQKAEAGKLERIAPRRFNPDNDAWLPILHTKHDGWKFTALFSNTAQAHELDKTDDWVVIYYDRDDDDDHERQVTVVTETSGDLKGKRVVRGREAETRRYYAGQQT
jgi:putative hydrolase